LIENLIPILKW